MHVPMDVLWEHTQTPALHEQWDLRFTSITYLPRSSQDETQRFRYATRLAPGVEIVGDGETVAVRTLADGSRTSSLKFSSDSVISLIRSGSGYWKYVPVNDGIRFFTWYDYETRWGFVGRIVDRVIFRPAMSWATAWSFDRLRLWLERGISPTESVRQSWRCILSAGLAGDADRVPHASRCLRAPPNSVR